MEDLLGASDTRDRTQRTTSTIHVEPPRIPTIPEATPQEILNLAESPTRAGRFQCSTKTKMPPAARRRGNNEQMNRKIERAGCNRCSPDSKAYAPVRREEGE
jgi:hypothetical protein